MEVWDLYDADRVKLGKTISRKDKALIPDGEYYLSVHAAIFDGEGRMLIQKRTEDKEVWPGLWDITVGGAVTSGEDSSQGIERELFEELGIAESFRGVRPHITIHAAHAICDTYILVRDIDVSTLVFQPSEVVEARYATLDEILDMLKDGRFIPYRESYIRLLFDIRSGRGTHIKMS